MRWLRDTPVGVRLALAFGVVGALLVVVVIAGLSGSSRQHQAQEVIVQDARIARAVQQLKFRVADVKARQIAYAFDALRGVGDAADDSGASRGAFLEAASAFGEEVRAVDVATLTEADREVLRGIEQGFETFLAQDEAAAALYRDGSPSSREQATAIVLQDEEAAFEAMEEGADRLTASVAEDSERSRRAGDRAADRARALMLLAGAVALVSATVLALLIRRSLTAPLRRAVEVLRTVASGDLTVRVDSTSEDEVGQMGAALNDTLDTMQRTVDSISNGSATLSSSSEELSAVSQEMSAAAEETAAQAATVSAAAEQVSTSLQSVSAGAEELGSSIQEIASNTSDAAAVASRAVSVAEATDDTVRKLGASSSEIGAVIKTITSIAEQTNLLALNATIEAARAGESGKGFAVVADEVKDLARKTARSSEEIARKIEGIQADSRQAVTAIAEIAGIIGQINDIQTVIAASVEEQSATTSEIGRSVTEAAEGSAEIARNITGVAEAAQGVTQGAAETHRSAEDLAGLAGELLGLVGQFRLAGQPAVAPWPDRADRRRSNGGRSNGNGHGPPERPSRTPELQGAGASW